MIRRSSTIAVLLLAACGSLEAGLEDSQRAHIWPPVDPREAASPAPVTSFTVRYSEWLNRPEQLRQAVAEGCGPRFTSARLYHYPGTGSLTHPQEYVVYCGDLRLRQRVYPETGQLSENLQQLNYPIDQGEPGELIQLR
jgi:hypothetical protein